MTRRSLLRVVFISIVAVTIAVVLAREVLASCQARPPARDSAAAAVNVPTGTAVLGGVIVDGDHQAVARATVTISGDMTLTRAMSTDDQGRFSFAGLPAGRYKVTAEKAGYPEMSYGAKAPFRTGAGLVVKDGQTIDNVSLTLARGGVITGTVYDDHGQPMPGVPVMPWELSTTLSGERTVRPAPTAGNGDQTDDRGMYRFFGLPPGEFTIGTAWFYTGGEAVRVPTDEEIQEAFAAAGRPGGMSPDRSTTPPAPQFSFSPIFYPSAVDPLSASTISLAAGEVREGVDLHMQRLRMSRIEGTVSATDGSTPSISMALFHHGRSFQSGMTTFWSATPDGHFNSNTLPPGDYTVMATATVGGAMMWASADVTLSDAEPSVSLTLQPTIAMPGRVVFDGTTIAPPDRGAIRLFLSPLEGTSAIRSFAPPVVDSAGAFSMTGLTPGQYRLTAAVPGNAAPGAAAWTLASVTADGHDVTDRAIGLNGSIAPSLVVTFTDRVSKLSGAIQTTSGRAASDYFVVVLPADRSLWLPQTRRIVTAHPDVGGHYVFFGLPAGDYLVAATTDLSSDDLGDAKALEQLAAQSVPATLATGEQKIIDLRIGG